MADELPAPISSRRYSDTEVARIIKDASELQQESSTPSDPASGLSLTELEAIAREAGLDPALVRRAAANLDSSVPEEKPSRLLGAPRTIILERTIEGEVSPDQYEVMALEIQRALGGIGTTSTFGRSLQWTSAPLGRGRRAVRVVQVTVTPRNGCTTIRIEEPFGQVAIALFAASVGGIGMGFMPLVSIGAGVMASSTLGPGAAVVVGAGTAVVFLGGIFSIARYAYGRVVRGRSETLQRLMARLGEHITPA